MNAFPKWLHEYCKAEGLPAPEKTNGGHWRIRVGSHVVITPDSPRNPQMCMKATKGNVKRARREQE